MSDFKRAIPVKGHGRIIFEFIKINKVEHADYFITLNVKKENISFRMRKRSENWKIVDAPKVPDWIMDIESQLSDILVKKQD